MKKLDEIMELMTEEMADFKNSLIALEKLSKQLMDLSIPISTEVLEKSMDIYLKKLDAENRERKLALEAIDKKFVNARIVPNYLLIILEILGVFTLGSLVYFNYTANSTHKENIKIYQMILESENQLSQVYMEEHPEIKKAYCRWLEDQQ